MRCDPMLTASFFIFGMVFGMGVGGSARLFSEIGLTSCSTNEVREVTLEVECANANWV